MPIAVGLMPYMKTTIKSIVDQLSYEELIVNYQRVKKIQKKKKKSKMLYNLNDQDGILYPP